MKRAWTVHAAAALVLAALAAPAFGAAVGPAAGAPKPQVPEKAAPKQAAPDNPRWKVLVLVYAATDFEFSDDQGKHHLVAAMTDEEKRRAESQAKRFFEQDVPQLTRGLQRPIVTVKFARRTLTRLEGKGGYAPGPDDAAPDAGPAFDSVVVVWKSAGTDKVTGRPLDVADAGGLTTPRGTEPTYCCFPIGSLPANHRNVFKHEWGHSILFYYEAAGKVPLPAVDNHIDDKDHHYAHWPTGEAYVLEDETDDHLIPNSIYHNTRGFTHDYYTGQTATADKPERRLGITAEAWASGGPVTRPARPKAAAAQGAPPAAAKDVRPAAMQPARPAAAKDARPAAMQPARPPAAAGWPQFRGPTGDGIAAGKAPPLEWSETRNIRWKVALPGRGGSSPVVLGDRVWLTTALEQGTRQTKLGPDDVWVADRVSLAAVCLDLADGRLVWQTTLFEVDKPPPVHVFNTFATPTPVVAPGRLYCDFGAMGTACVDAADGKVLWTRRLPIDHMVGPGSSPILCGDRLILVRDGCDVQFLAALQCADGEVAWKTDRPPLEGRPDMKKAFSTPLLIDVGGQTQMVSVGAQWAVSYDPQTGREIWRVHHGSGFSTAPRPLYGNGLVYFCTGCPVGQLWAVRPDGRGDVTATHVAWKATEQIPTMSSPLLVGREIYGAGDRGRITCFDALTGETVWKHTTKGMYMASPVAAGERVYFFGREGTTTVLRAGREEARLAENTLEGQITASPAVADGALLLRTDTHLYCIAETPSPAP